MKNLQDIINHLDDSESLDLSNKNLSAAEVTVLTAALENNKSVKTINLYNCHLDAQKITILMQVFVKNSSVTTINLRLNSIRSKGAEAVAAVLKTNQSITDIDLGSNNIDEKGIIRLIQVLEVSSIIKIDLSKNEINQQARTAAANINSSVKIIGVSIDEQPQELPWNVLIEFKYQKSNTSIEKLSQLQQDSSWYTDDRVCKLLKIGLKDKAVNIAAPTVFEHKELLVANVTAVVEEVMSSDKPTAVMPLHMHNNHWTGLVIKKLSDYSIIAIYNDPKGQPLFHEENYGVLVKTIAKLIPDLKIIDLRVQLQHNDNDCGPWTVQSLIKLATAQTELCDYQQTQQLLQELMQKSAADIGINHTVTLSESGTPVADDLNYFDHSGTVEPLQIVGELLVP